jgi:hypothetical protein
MKLSPCTCKNKTFDRQCWLYRACAACPLNQTACFNPQCVTADGYERGILTVNRGLPGPSIQVHILVQLRIHTGEPKQLKLW